jgi:beta-galactosidase
MDAAAMLSTDVYRGPEWEIVNLPHSAKLQDETDPKIPSFQGIVWYRKEFPASPEYAGKRVVLKFDAAMQTADLWVNGKWQKKHDGGYLPFTLDLSQTLGVGKNADVLVRLDNRDNSAFNPGRSQSQLDFTYAGGLYRDVTLEVTNHEHIEDVYATSSKVSPQEADVAVQVRATLLKPGAQLRFQLISPEGAVIGEPSVSAKPGTDATIRVRQPRLWDLDHPYLYRIRTTLYQDGRQLDETVTRFGIRKLEFDHHSGVKINGKPLKLEGSNRHMAFPVVGNAGSDAAQYREAHLLKSLGLNILRLAHYPQSPAFLDACDKLGILVIDPIPGWQFFRDTPEFRNHVLSDVRQTVLRDRNHPCVAIFETCLNETYNAPDSFWRECHELAHQTFAPGNFFTGGDSYGKHDDSHPIWDVPWTGWDDDTFARPALFENQMGIDREYGDYEFGGEQSTSRADRSNGEGALMLQAWNFIWSHNRNRGNSWSFGDLTWEAIDTRRGMSTDSPISKSGLLDFYRLPKPVANFYKSQGLETPYVRIANEWTPRPNPAKVVVFSNCEEVALVLNGKVISRQQPDSGPTTGYLGPKVSDPLYWAHGKGDILPATSTENPVGGSVGALPFSGGNCRNLAHPPFTFESVSYLPGKLEAVAYSHGHLVARDHITTPLTPDHVVIRVATEGRTLQADGSDFVFVYASVCDRNGQVVPTYNSLVRLLVSGPAETLLPEGRPAVAGIAPFMVRSKTNAGRISLTAVATVLHLARISFNSVVRP